MMEAELIPREVTEEKPLVAAPSQGAAKEVRSVSSQELKPMDCCPFCNSIAIEPREDGKTGYECKRCDSVFLGNGTGITIKDGLISDVAQAKNLTQELSTVTGEVCVSGPFRGNAQLFQIPEISLPSMQSVVIAATNAGLTVERADNILLLRK